VLCEQKVLEKEGFKSFKLKYAKEVAAEIENMPAIPLPTPTVPTQQPSNPSHTNKPKPRPSANDS
jgi:hypothetical protein